MEPKIEKHHHYILPNKTIIAIGASLLVLTVVTVWVAQIDLGRLNFLIAMLVASVKASLVALFFMNLMHDRRENGVIFATSFLFLAIFIVLTATDLFFRGDVYVKGPLIAQAQGKAKFKKAWVARPELLAHGKALFAAQCVACHGAEGKGNGPAAAALNPPPRNFTQAAGPTSGWKNGRKPSQIFKTLKEGIPGTGMASFATLPAEDRWALSHYVMSLGPSVETDTPADLAKVGIDPNKEETAGGGEAPTISVELALARMSQPSQSIGISPPLAASPMGSEAQDEKSMGGRLYQSQCLQCHGSKGEGGVPVRNLGVNPRAFVTTQAFTAQSAGLKSQEAFAQFVSRGLPGELMPGNGHLTLSEMQDLFQFVKSLAAR